ncbi:1386_t:CDS:2 [Funneliformis geosporum]|uniref:7942_t:CDS:1 n=1 Tax=Funneliformis geosporum TaxID=1117311 RepID=A0A9W4SQW2_9GLOM|nr:7942_t:CDS:2 [Funneliformis geosporum]CAI2185085.1 1386_t:CDS:2 [Funneliformis geosporum]
MPASKTRKVPERPTTRASTKTAHANGDFAVKQRLRSYPNAVTPSSTVSPATTRASSVESARETTHRKASSRTNTRSCHNNKNDGVVTRRSTLQKECIEEGEIIFESHSSDDEAFITLKHTYRKQKRRADEIVIQFKSLKERMFNSRINDLDEDNNAIQEGCHPRLSKQMDEIEEKHKALTLRAERRREYHKNAIEAAFAAQEKQIRDEFMNDRHKLRTMMIEELEKKKSQLKREYYRKPEDNLLDLVMKKIEGTPFDPNYKIFNKGSDTTRTSFPIHNRLPNGQPRTPRTNIDIQYRTNEEEMAEDLMAMQLWKPVRLPPQSSSSKFHSTNQPHPNIISSTSSVIISPPRRKKEPRTKRPRRNSNRETVSETRRETPIILAPKEFSKTSLRETPKVSKTIHRDIPSELLGRETSKELPRISPKETLKDIGLHRETPREVFREVREVVREPPREIVREPPRELPREIPKDLSMGTSQNPNSIIVSRWLAEDGTEEDNDSDQ